jgi:hypothetical protein
MGLVETKRKEVLSRAGAVTHYRLKWEFFVAEFRRFLKEQGEKSDVDIARKLMEQGEESDVDMERKLMEQDKESSRTLNISLTSSLTSSLTPSLDGREVKYHPAVEIYLRVTGLPELPKRAETLIVKARIEMEAQMQLWETVVRNYIGCGWNPQNVVNMLGYYNRGEIPAVKKPEPAETGYQFGTIEDFE